MIRRFAVPRDETNRVRRCALEDSNHPKFRAAVQNLDLGTESNQLLRHFLHRAGRARIGRDFYSVDSFRASGHFSRCVFNRSNRFDASRSAAVSPSSSAEPLSSSDLGKMASPPTRRNRELSRSNSFSAAATSVSLRIHHREKTEVCTVAYRTGKKGRRGAALNGYKSRSEKWAFRARCYFSILPEIRMGVDSLLTSSLRRRGGGVLELCGVGVVAQRGR